MSDLTTPGEQGAGASRIAAGNAWDKAWMPWIVPTVDIADEYSPLDETQLDGFRHATSSGLDVTIAAGEAYVGGWLCRDRTTTITLPASATTTLYVGIDIDAILPDATAPADHENIIIGPASDFENEDPKAPLYEFTTDSAGVTGTTDLRKTTQPVEFDPVADRVDITADLAVRGNLVATETYVDTNRYTDGEARQAVVGTDLPGTQMSLPNVDGHPDGLLMANDNVAYSARAGDTVIYNLNDGGAIVFRNYTTGPGNLTTVDSITGDLWTLGDISAGDGETINPGGASHLQPYVLGSNESLPSDTVTGRMVYDPSREQ